MTTGRGTGRTAWGTQSDRLAADVAYRGSKPDEALLPVLFSATVATYAAALASNRMHIVSTSTVRWVPETMPLVLRQLLHEYLQVARVVTSACIAIAIGLVSLSYGIASLGFDTLTELAREMVSD
jgi:hypothetical protein